MNLSKSIHRHLLNPVAVTVARMNQPTQRNFASVGLGHFKQHGNIQFRYIKYATPRNNLLVASTARTPAQIGKRCASTSSKATNAYQVLNVNENATQDEIKKAFYRLAFDHHPDRIADGTSDKEKQDKTALFILITHAYEILSNPSKRNMYDIDRKHGLDPLFNATARQRQPTRSGSNMDPWHKPEYEMRWDEFDMFYQRGMSGNQPWRRGAGFARPDPNMSAEEVRQRDKPMYALIGMFVFAAVGMMVAQLTRMRQLMAESLDLKSREANLYLSQAVLKSKQGGRGFKEKEIQEARQRKKSSALEAET